jgi:hypothetical protein
MPDEPTHYLNLALASALTGGGLYAGLRGLRNIKNMMYPPEDTSTRALDITLPKDRLPKHMSELPMDKYAQDSALEAIWNGGLDKALPVATVGLGLYGGWKAAQGVNSYIANNSIAAQKEQVKQNYLAALRKAAVKTASCNTPHVDSFIRGLMEQTEKQAEDEPLSWFDSHISKPVSNMAHGFVNGVAKSDIAKWVAGAGMLAAGGTGLATYYLANRIDQNKEDARQKSQLPTEIHLNVK